jgi:multidrug resistance efflux pump
MDIARPNVAREKRRRRIIYGVLAVVAVSLVTMGLSRLKPAPPSVDRSSAVIDTVHRGDFLRQVHGIGSLVVEDVRWIPAITEGRVEKIDVLLPGTDVKADTVLLEMSNPQLQQEALDAELKLKASEADYHNLEVQLQSTHLTQKADTAKANQDYSEAKMKAETDAELAKLGVISDQAQKVSQGQAQQLSIRSDIERQRLDNTLKLTEAQLAVKKAEVDGFRALAALKHQQMEALKVRAGTKGVLQEMAMKVGQWVTPGTNLAKVVQPDHLKAELNIAETQAKDILRGQPASIDTHNGVIHGRVSNMNPTAQNGTVTVDVALEGTAPGARPDLSVDGTIDLERLTSVLFTGRPAFGQEGGNLPVSMFKVDPDGKTATRIQVRLGRSSVTTVEIVDGLKEGDQVILSDMSRWDKFDRIRLE